MVIGYIFNLKNQFTNQATLCLISNTDTNSGIVLLPKKLPNNYEHNIVKLILDVNSVW